MPGTPLTAPASAVVTARYIWADRAYLLGKRRERAIQWVVWRLPREWVMWAYIRVGAHATTGCYENTVVPEITMMEALRRWDEPDGAPDAPADNPGPVEAGGLR